MARVGERAIPPQHAPRAVRRLLNHARLTSGAAKVVRKALEEDGEFRARVAQVATEETVGRPGVLFLTRPDGWEQELAELIAAEAETEEAEGEEREKRTTVRRLKGAERARRRAEEALAEVKAQATRAAADLAEERRSRKAAEAEVEALAARVAALERDRGSVSSGAGAGVEAEELLALRRRIEELETAPERVVEVVRHTEAADAALQDRVRRLLTDAADAARTLAATLAEASAEVEAAAVPVTAGEPAAAPSVPEAGRRPVPPRRRKPAPLLPGIRDDSPEAAEYLVRRGGALLLVDGYNASLRYRSDLPIAELRRRFVDALDEMAARTGVDVHVVFDGADTEGSSVPAVSRRGRARVTFSPADVEADDVILELVGATPVARVVLVASNDRRVRTGAEEQGANLLTIDQLLAVLRRERE